MSNKRYECPECKSSDTNLDFSYPVMDTYPEIAVCKCNKCSAIFDVELEG